jgi:hypothetical protein
MPLFWNPVVRNELVPVLDPALAPRVTLDELSRSVEKTSAADVEGDDSPKKSQAAIWAVTDDGWQASKAAVSPPMHLNRLTQPVACCWLLGVVVVFMGRRGWD